MNTSEIINFGNPDPAYIDLTVCIRLDSGVEYEFVVSAERKSGEVSEDIVGMAVDFEAPFVECEMSSVPEDVKAEFDRVRPAMLERLKKECEK